jgi:hypothetical protein
VALLTGRPLRATRPLHFFRADGAMPDALELPLTIPTELGPAAAVISELRDRVRTVERARAAERLRTGARVQGRRAVLAQSWHDHPASYEPRRNLRPRVATRSKWARIEALLRNRAFAVAYANARERWRHGASAAFPPAPTGSNGSPPCLSSRHDLVFVYGRSRTRIVECGAPTFAGCLIAPSQRLDDRRCTGRP